MRSAIFDLVVHDLLNEPHDIAPELGLLDAHECLGESEPVGGGEEVGDIIRRVHLLVTLSLRGSSWVFEEEGNRRLKEASNLLQSAGTDAVRSFLVLLYLLKRHADRICKLGLAH